MSRFRVERFRSDYRRHGCNWAVYLSGNLACDSVGNGWFFKRKKDGEAYLETNKPTFWLVNGVRKAIPTEYEPSKLLTGAC